MTEVHDKEPPAERGPAYWLTRPVEERFAEVERLRLERMGFADNPEAQPRLDKTRVVIRRLHEDDDS